MMVDMPVRAPRPTSAPAPSASSQTGARRAGKPQNFTDEQNELLRRELVAFKERNGLTQEELGKKLDVEQQSAGRLLSVRGSGFSYVTATRAAQLLGYVGVDAFFLDKGVALGQKAPDVDPTIDARQAQGMVHARALGASEKAIQLVNRRVDKVNYYSAAWWCTRYLEQEEALREARAELKKS